MTVARINRISEFEGQTVQLNGWVYNSRRIGKIGFLMFRDGFGIIQCIVAKNDVGEDTYKVFKSLTQESSISVQGKIVKNDRAPGGYELVLSDSVEKTTFLGLSQAPARFKQKILPKQPFFWKAPQMGRTKHRMNI